MTPKELLELAEKATQGKYHIGHVSEHEPIRMDIESDDGFPVADDVHERDVNYFFACHPTNLIPILKAASMMAKALKPYTDDAIFDPELYDADGNYFPTSHWTKGAIEALAEWEKLK